jgi:hypothetical protein
MLAGPANFDVPAGQYESLILVASGTNAGGATLALANLGLITATWRGAAFMSERFDDLNTLSRLVGGIAENASAIGAAFRMMARIRASYGNDGNVFDITDDDDVRISVDLSGLGALVAAGNLQLFGVMQDGAQAYVPRLFHYVHALPASNQLPEDIKQDNVSHLMLTVLTNLARVQVEKDNAPWYQCTTADALSLSNNDYRVEAAAETDAILLSMNRSGLFNEALSDDVRLTLEAGAGGAAAVRVTSISIDPTPDVLARSRSTLDTKVVVKRERKTKLGKTRAVTVDAAIQGK